MSVIGNPPRQPRGTLFRVLGAAWLVFTIAHATAANNRRSHQIASNQRCAAAQWTALRTLPAARMM
jgi:hypothetical protein